MKLFITALSLFVSVASAQVDTQMMMGTSNAVHAVYVESWFLRMIPMF
jgi:hypothetical protein